MYFFVGKTTDTRIIIKYCRLVRTQNPQILVSVSACKSKCRSRDNRMACSYCWLGHRIQRQATCIKCFLFWCGHKIQRQATCTKCFLFWCGHRIQREATCIKCFLCWLGHRIQRQATCIKCFLFWCGHRIQREATCINCFLRWLGRVIHSYSHQPFLCKSKRRSINTGIKCSLFG